MKKYIYMLLLAVMSIGLFSCDKSDEDGSSGALIGRWEAVSEYEYKNGQWVEVYEFSANECVWVFTDKTVTVYDDEDLLNNQTVSYTYDEAKKTITVFGALTHTISSLTKTELVVIINGALDKVVFKRIN